MNEENKERLNTGALKYRSILTLNLGTPKFIIFVHNAASPTPKKRCGVVSCGITFDFRGNEKVTTEIF